MPGKPLCISLILAIGLMAFALGCFGGSSAPPMPEATEAPVPANAELSAEKSTPTPLHDSAPTPVSGLTPKPAPTPTTQTISTPSPQPTLVPDATPVPTPMSEPTPTPLGYDSNAAMYDIFPGFTTSMPRTLETLEDISENDDTSMVPVLVEIMRFMPSQSSRDSVAETLRALTGQPFGGNDWDKWMDWMGANLDSIEPPEGYPDWKASLYSIIDERFAHFLRLARDFSRIRLEEVAWGGVRPDGIPDLRGPTFVEAAEADYMNPDDRVFGLEINGDVRAYPLRVINAHEMVNDTVGGEPISLMW